MGRTIACERKPPEGWPGGPCTTPARYDVVYQLRTQQEPRGARLCMVHLTELRELQYRGMMTDRGIDVQEIRG